MAYVKYDPVTTAKTRQDRIPQRSKLLYQAGEVTRDFARPVPIRTHHPYLPQARLPTLHTRANLAENMIAYKLL